MLPSQGSIIVEPISDQILYNETMQKARWWMNSMYDIDFSGYYDAAVEEAFSQPVVGPVAAHLLLSNNTRSYQYTNDHFAING